MKKLSISFFMLVLLGALTLALPVPAQAMPALGQADPLLSKAFKTELQWLDTQQQALAKADQAAAQVQQVADKAAAEGLDVSLLQNALSMFESEMAAAQAEHQIASDILSARAGFDAEGNVTDTQAARVTVLDAKQSLWKAHVTMTQAVRSLHQAVRDWRQVTFPQDDSQG